MDGVGEDQIVKRDALGRVTTSRERREALLDEFERSGLKGTQFARVVGVNYQTFASWVQKRRHARGAYAARGGVSVPSPKATGLALVEAVMPTHVADRQPDTGAGLQIHLPGGAAALVTTPQQARLAAELLQALRTSC